MLSSSFNRLALDFIPLVQAFLCWHFNNLLWTLVHKNPRVYERVPVDVSLFTIIFMNWLYCMSQVIGDFSVDFFLWVYGLRNSYLTSTYIWALGYNYKFTLCEKISFYASSLSPSLKHSYHFLQTKRNLISSCLLTVASCALDCRWETTFVFIINWPLAFGILSSTLDSFPVWNCFIFLLLGSVSVQEAR